MIERIFSMSNDCDASVMAPLKTVNKVEINEESKDSGINSSTSSSKGFNSNIIIPFRALNSTLEGDGSLNMVVLQSSVIGENKIGEGLKSECSTIQGTANVGRDISKGNDSK